MSETLAPRNDVPEHEIGSQAAFDDFMRRGMDLGGRVLDQVMYQKYGEKRGGSRFAEEVRAMDMDPAMGLIKEIAQDREERHAQGAEQEADYERYLTFLQHQSELSHVGHELLDEMEAAGGAPDQKEHSLPKVVEKAVIAAPRAREADDDPR